MVNLIVAKFGGSSLADSKQFVKVKDIIIADSRRKYIIPSAPGKVCKKDHKVTDLLYMCYQLASHNLNIDEVFAIIEERFLKICEELVLDIKMEEILEDIKMRIQSMQQHLSCLEKSSIHIRLWMQSMMRTYCRSALIM